MQNETPMSKTVVTGSNVDEHSCRRQTRQSKSSGDDLSGGINANWRCACQSDTNREEE